MKIAVSAENAHGLASPVCAHFGHSPYFAIVAVDANGQPGEVVSSANPCFENHSCGNVVAFIRSQGADVMLSGGMGPGAIMHFNQFGIEVCTGASGTVGEAVEAYVKGQLRGIGVTCDHGGGNCH